VRHDGDAVATQPRAGVVGHEGNGLPAAASITSHDETPRRSLIRASSLAKAMFTAC
jgi:hypothetical protein